MTLPPITTKQHDILKLVYRYRFVDRIQLQAFMGHKNKRRIAEWLKDLRDKQYLEWIYDGDDFAGKTKPAIYYLGINGVRFLKTVVDYDDNAVYSLDQLRKRYRESSRKPEFIAKSVLLVDCCLDIIAKSTGKLTYTFVTQADYAEPGNKYHFLAEELKPDVCYERLEHTKQTSTIKNYLIVALDASQPRHMVKKCLKDYITYLYEGSWKRRFTGSELIVHIICPDKAEFIYAKRRARTLLEDIGRDTRAHIGFATIEKVKQRGVTGIIWEDA